MHDVLDACDLVPDEAEQLLHSGYPVEDLLTDARGAARRGDYGRLGEIAVTLKSVPRRSDWAYIEPSDPAILSAGLERIPRMPIVASGLPLRIHGAWLGRCVANTMGKPVEGLTPVEVGIYLRAVGQWPQTGYIPLLEKLPAGVSHLHESAPFASAGTFDDVPRDDDLDWTILGLALLEEFGNALTTEEIARAWLDRLPFTQTFTAERAAYRNVIRGIPLDETGEVDNPYREWVGALIRADIFGYTNPGNPGRAARLALTDAVISHRANGIYGEMWAAAVVAAAFGTTDVSVALDAALKSVPIGSRLAESQRALIGLRRSGGSSDEALAWINQHLGHYNWVHTVNNAALIATGLLWGTDFTSSVALTISGGRDTDSTAATVGSVYGAIHGVDAIPADLVGTTHVRVRSAVRDFDRIEIAELAERTRRLAVCNGGLS